MNIEVKNITKKFKENIIIDDVTIAFKENNVYGLYGRNGTGKSVFLKLLCGFYEPTSGEILINGKNYHNCTEFPPNLRALIEKPNFFPDLTGFENLQMLASIQNKISDKEIDDALKIVNLTSEKHKKYSEYSLGMKQKLGIAQAIMENPDIIILDEPFNGIEESTIKEVIKYLRRIKKNKIIILSTHIKDDLNAVADKIYNFDAGKINEINKFTQNKK